METLYGIKVVWGNWQSFDEDYWKNRIHFSQNDKKRYTFSINNSKLLLYIATPEKRITGY